MTNTELVAKVAESMDITKKLSKEVVEAVFEAVKEGMIADGEVKISGFGAFRVKDVAARNAINPQDGTPLVINAHKRPTFKASSVLKTAVNE